MSNKRVGPPPLLSPRCSALGVVLDRLALGAHARNHRAHLPHAYAVGNLDLNLLLIDHLGDLTNQPTGRNHGVAAAQVLDQVLVLLHPLLLGPQDQKVHQGDDWDHHHQRRGQQTVAERAGLRISGRHEHRLIPWISVGRDRLFCPCRPAVEVGADYNGHRLNCNVAAGHIRAVPPPEQGHACGTIATPVSVRRNPYLPKISLCPSIRKSRQQKANRRSTGPRKAPCTTPRTSTTRRPALPSWPAS